MSKGSTMSHVGKKTNNTKAVGALKPAERDDVRLQDINAEPGQMGAHGHLGDGGCDCQGLTMRGRHFLIFDTKANVEDRRRSLSEIINYPPTLAFASTPIPADKAAPFSGIAAELPPNVKLVTVTSNYKDFNNGSFLLRLAHLYSTGEESALAAPVTFSLASVFAKQGLKIASISETSLTANQPIAEMDAKKFNWNTEACGEVLAQLNSAKSYETRVPFDSSSDDLSLTLRPMEVRTFLANFE